ncbi:MAG: metallophosphoesterase [candidate division NC10 bacterium]|nr:metallophosphoesterase [candidate division NC10 bacterium]
MLFVLVVFSVYLGMNGYVLARLFHLFAISKTVWFYLALIPLALSFIVALALESRFGNQLTGGFFALAMLWLGTCGLLLWILLAQQILALVIPLPQRVWAIGACGLACGLALYAFVNARTITVRHEQIPRLPLKIAHLSDIHIGSIGPSTLADIIAKTNDLKPDLILITGDLFDNATPGTRATAAQLKRFAAPVLFTSGNHEDYTGHDNVRQMLAATQIRWLRNETIDFNGIRIIGVDNSHGTQLLQAVLGRTPPSPAYTILMNHQPTGFDIAAHRGIGLMLSGHVHNGQIWPFNCVVGLFYPYLKGLHANGGALLNVSTGTGIWGPPMRLGSRSEIVLLEPMR